MAGHVKKRAYDSPRRREQAASTRAAILDAALKLFEQQGYVATPVAAIAKEAGVALKTVYAVFGTKRGVLVALRSRLVRGGPRAVPGRPEGGVPPGARGAGPRAAARHVRRSRHGPQEPCRRDLRDHPARGTR